MARSKPKKKFVWVQDISPFKLDEKYREALFRVIRTKTQHKKSVEFIGFIENEIWMLKPQRRIEIESPSQQEVKEEITRFKRQTKKLQEKSIRFQQELGDLGAESRRLLRNVWQNYYDGTQELHVSDFLSDLDSRISHLLLVINETERITLKKGRPTNISLRQFSKRLACAFQDIFGERPTKARTGAFGKTLNICLEVAGHSVEDSFPLIKEAVDYNDKLNTPLK